ncbi:hypothetical protein ScPMuIL_012190 [Solemya velum]
MEKMRMKFGVVTTAVLWLPLVLGHGRLIEPPSRSSMHRYGFNTPANFNDNELFCGGFQNQWERNNGACGVCGDPIQGPYDNEAGGKFATDTIARCYPVGTTSIGIKVDVTANHLGFFEYRLCEHNNTKTRFSQDCLDENLLREAGTGNTQFSIGTTIGVVKHTVNLPPTLTCTQCVLQWRYHTGNSWGCGSSCCVGCGPQEEFYGCADIAILPDCGNIPQGIDVVGSDTAHNNSNPVMPGGDTWSSETDTPQTTTKIGPEMPQTTLKIKPEMSQTTQKIEPEKPTTAKMNEDTQGCRAIGVFAKIGGMDRWCATNCGSAQSSCPASMCSCQPRVVTTVANTGCKSREGSSDMNHWCQTVCSHESKFCPPKLCICGV